MAMHQSDHYCYYLYHRYRFHLYQIPTHMAIHQSDHYCYYLYHVRFHLYQIPTHMAIHQSDHYCYYLYHRYRFHLYQIPTHMAIHQSDHYCYYLTIVTDSNSTVGSSCAYACCSDHAESGTWVTIAPPKNNMAVINHIFATNPIECFFILLHSSFDFSFYPCG